MGTLKKIAQIDVLYRCGHVEPKILYSSSDFKIEIEHGDSDELCKICKKKRPVDIAKTDRLIKNELAIRSMTIADLAREIDVENDYQRLYGVITEGNKNKKIRYKIEKYFKMKIWSNK
jgi:hypothetical protein